MFRTNYFFVVLVFQLFFIACQNRKAEIENCPPCIEIIPDQRLLALSSEPYPRITSLPCSFKLNKEQFRLLNFEIQGRKDKVFLDINTQMIDSFYHVSISAIPHYSFFTGFLQAISLSPYPGITNWDELFIKCYFDVDILYSKGYPILSTEVVDEYLHTSDSIIILYSNTEYFKNNPDESDNIYLFILLNVNKRTSECVTFDSIGNLIDRQTIFNASDTISSYSIYVPKPSTVRVVKTNKILYPEKGYYQLDSTEINRFYINRTGHIFNWTNNISASGSYCIPPPPDSIMDPISNPFKNSVFVPLSLKMEKQLKWILDRTRYTIRYFELNSNVDLTYFFSYPVFQENGFHYFTVQDNAFNQFILVSADSKGNIKDAYNLLYSKTLFPIEDFKDRIAQIGRNKNIYTLKRSSFRDTIDIVTWQDEKINTLGTPTRFLTVPFSDLENYFPRKDLKIFNIESFSDSLSYPENNPMFPDTIESCLQEMAAFNGGNLFGRPFCIHHSTNGLTYWMMLYYGNLGSSIVLFVVNKDNVLQNSFLTLSSSEGDEGDYGYSKGEFTQDSLYRLVSFSHQGGQYQTTEDSTIHHFIISSTGKIILDHQRTEIYTRILSPDVN
jgi:hypothetical protein